MDIGYKTNEQLINELMELQSDHNSLKLLYEKTLTENKFANDQLQVQMQNLDAVFESSPVAMFVIDDTTNIVMTNLAFTVLCGGTESDILQHRPGNALRCVHSHIDPRGCGFASACKFCNVRNGVEALISNGGSLHGAELELELTRNGKPGKYWMNIGVEPFTMNGKGHWCIAMDDVTDRKKAEEIFRKKDMEFRKLSANVPDLIFQFTRKPDGTYFVPIASEGIRNVFGCSPEDVMDDFTPIGRVIYPLDAERVIREIEYSAEHLSPFTCEYRVQIPGKCIKWMYSKSTPEKLPDGSITWYGFNTDITQKKLAEEELKSVKTSLELCLEASQIGIWSHNLIEDPEHIKEVSVRDLKHDQIFGYKEKLASWGQEKMLEHVIDEDREATRKAFDEIFEKGRLDFECRILWPDNTIHWIACRGKVFKDVAGQPNQIHGTVMDITERKLAEQELIIAKQKTEESESRFRSIVENTDAGYFFIDNDGIFQSVNRAWLNHYKYSSFDEVIGKHFTLVQKLEDVESAKTFVNGIRAGDHQFMIGDFSRKCADGSLGYHSFSARPVFINNMIAGIEGFIIDTTKQKAFEQELLVAKEKVEKSEVKYHSMFSSMQEGVYLHTMIYDNKGKAVNYRIDEANAASEKYLNIKPEDAVGKLATDLFRTEEAPFLDVYSKVAETGVPTAFEQYFQPMDKHFFISVFSPRKGEFATVFQDITDKKLNELNLLHAKEKAQENELRLGMAQNVSHTGVWDWHIQDNLFHWSDELLRIFGLPKETIPGFESWSKILHPEDIEMASKKIEEAIANHTNLLNQYRILTPGNEIRWIESSGHTFYEDDKPVRMLGMCMDITERKRIEEELIKAKEHAEESDRLKSAFLANMSHEIRTPMNGILGFSELLKEPGLSGDEQREYINVIEKSGARMLNIISEIIDISKIESGQMEISLQKTNINETLEDTYKLLKPDADSRKIELSFKSNISDKEAFALTDKYKLYSILTNLVKNAIKYTDKGSIVFGCELNDETFEFFVKDTGVGIPKDRQGAIFGRFIQADIKDIQARQGAGLGLSISKAFVEMLGGRIWVESEVDVGSTFYFALPNPNGSPKQILNESKGSDPKFGYTNSIFVPQLKILIVEDDETSEMYLSILTKDFSRELLRTTNGVEAIQICRNNPDIDLILMDINMPEMGGYEATRQIRKSNQEVVIIAQTAYGLLGDREKSLEAGCNDHISKPIKSEELKALIMKYFSK